MLELVTPDTDLATPANIGQIANRVAAKNAFADYRTRKAANTIKRQDADLTLFAAYLEEVGAAVDCWDIAVNPERWQGLTWGLVEGFVHWQLKQGFAVSSVNVRLSTVRSYAKLAVKAGTLDEREYAMIRIVSGYSRKEAKHIDEARQEADVPTRYNRPGAKKGEAVSISKIQAKKLKTHPDTPQGRRDALLMALLLNHGLRVGEVAQLQVTDFDLKAGELHFYRPKVDKIQTHKLTAGTLRAAHAYFEQDAPAIGSLLRGSRKGGKLTSQGMSERAITKRVKTLGEAIGIERLSAHDCRHYAATFHAKTRDIKHLMEIFGWASPAMAIRYIEDAKVVELE